MSIGATVRHSAKPDRLSYLCPTRDHQLLELTLGDLLDQAAVKYGNLTALVFPKRGSLTYSQLQKQTRILASGFAAIGLVRGNSVVTWGSNSLEMYLVDLACAKLGLELINVNPLLPLEEIVSRIKFVGAQCLVLGDDEGIDGKSVCDMTLSAFTNITPITLPNQRLCIPNLPSLTFIVHIGKRDIPGTFRYDYICENGAKPKYFDNLSHLESLVQLDDVCHVYFSSGTTGKSKAATRTHHTIVNEAFFFGRRFSLCPNDVIGITYTINYSVVKAHAISPAIAFGCTVVSPIGFGHRPGAYDPQTTRMLVSEKCTMFYADPELLQSMLKDPYLQENKMTTLRLVSTSSSPCSSELVQDIKTFLPVPFVMVSYGMSEIGGTLLSLPEDSHELQCSTVGYPSEMNEVKLINSDGAIVPIGCVGELCVRGIMVYCGKYDTPKLDLNNWYHTGDRMQMLKSGHCKYLGRMSDVILVGNVKVFPNEVEEIMNQHSQIKESRILGIPRESEGRNVIAAWIIAKETQQISESELRAYCNEKLATSQLPFYIHFVKEFPVNVQGKTDRRKMMAITKDLFNI